jgi:hypothetical protein
MRYQELSAGNYPYPDAAIDPKKKQNDPAYCAQYAKAAYSDFSFGVPKGVFANNNGDYEKFRMYAIGKQPNSPYKKWMGVDEQTNNTWLSNDWSIRAIVSTYRDKALSRCLKQRHNPLATPIDMLAKSELQQYYADMKAKLLMRQQMQQQGAPQELLNNPVTALSPGDPTDVEELEMRVQMGEQFNRSKDAELAIQYGFSINEIESVLGQWYQDGYDLGVLGYKEWLGEDNLPKFRTVNPENVVVSFTRDKYFNDIVHAGEVIEVSLIDLALVKDKEGNAKFTEEQLTEFAGTLAGKFGNPMSIGSGVGKMSKAYDKFKCKVLDLEFKTYDDYVYQFGENENGNQEFRKADFNRGKKSDKYTRKRYEMVYKCKWVIGTDHVYDFGAAYDQKRSNNIKRYAYTSLSYRFVAINFYEMKAQGFMERLIPYIDDYQLTKIKIQNFKNRAVPSGWWIDLDALENVALTKGGKAMEPKELLQMFFETGVLMGRSKDADGNPMGPNWKPVIPMSNTAMEELAGLYNDLVMNLQELEKISGYNDVTTGNPNPKTLTTGLELANESTNDSLFPLVSAVKYLYKKLSEDVLCRMQQGIKKGVSAELSSALNINTIQSLGLSRTICDREYGIMIEDLTTDEQKQWLFQMMNNDIVNGFLDTSDAVTLVNTHNAKQAQIIWSYKVKKAKEAMQANELQKIQLNNQGAQEAAQVAQEMGIKARLMEFDLQKSMKQMELEYQMQIEKMKIESMERIALYNNNTKLQVSAADHDGKVQSAEIQGQAKLVATDIQGIHGLEKQKIANEKPQASAKK